MHTTSTPNGTDPVEQALSLLAKGQAAEAAGVLRTQLKAHPGNAAAWHAFGCVALANGSAEAAVQCANKAIALKAQPHFYITLGQALLALGHAEQARAALHVAIMEAPRDPRAHQAMAEALEALGRIDDATQALRNALRLRPLEAERHLTLAAFLARHGGVAEAMEVSAHALALAPQNIFAQNQHAMLLERAGRLAQAAPFFGAVASALPTDAAALANHGAALFAQGNYQQARSELLQATTLQPSTPETLTNLGLAHMALGALPQAEQVLLQAHALNPHDARLATNYGTALTDMGQYWAAEKLFRQVEASPGASVIEQARAAFNLGTLLLTQGHFKEGWSCFEARKQLLPTAAAPQGLPAWHGQAQTHPVLLYAEQGLGDCLQFLRYVPAVAARAPVVPAAALSLVERIVFDGTHSVRVLAEGEAAQTCGATTACSLLSLPHVLGCVAPFAWAPVLQGVAPPAITMAHGVRVGLCWAGNSSYRFDKRRSLPAEVLAPLGHIAGLNFQSLQQGAQAGPITVLPLPEGDLLHTARLMAGLACVVTVDTAVAHLAGLLGKPTFLLNRFGGDWRWAQGSTTRGPEGQVLSKWYPRTQVITQPEPGEGAAPWRVPVQQVGAALRALVKKGG